jgi:hypothetical protein
VELSGRNVYKSRLFVEVMTDVPISLRSPVEEQTPREKYERMLGGIRDGGVEKEGSAREFAQTHELSVELLERALVGGVTTRFERSLRAIAHGSTDVAVQAREFAVQMNVQGYGLQIERIDAALKVGVPAEYERLVRTISEGNVDYEGRAREFAVQMNVQGYGLQIERIDAALKVGVPRRFHSLLFSIELGELGLEEEARQHAARFNDAGYNLPLDEIEKAVSTGRVQKRRRAGADFQAGLRDIGSMVD